MTSSVHRPDPVCPVAKSHSSSFWADAIARVVAAFEAFALGFLATPPLGDFEAFPSFPDFFDAVWFVLARCTTPAEAALTQRNGRGVDVDAAVRSAT